MGAAVVVEIATVLEGPWKVTKPMPTPFASRPEGRPLWKSWITCSIGPTSSMVIDPDTGPVPGTTGLGRTMAQPHISVRVSPSFGAPAGWKSVARWKTEKGRGTYRHPATSSVKLTSKRSAVSAAGFERLSKISAWKVRPVPAPREQKAKPSVTLHAD